MQVKKQRVLQIQPRNFHYSPIRFYEKEIKREKEYIIKKVQELNGNKPNKQVHPVKFPKKVNQSLNEQSPILELKKDIMKKASLMNKKKGLGEDLTNRKHFPSKSQLIEHTNSKVFLPKLTLRNKQPKVSLVKEKPKLKNSPYLYQDPVFKKQQKFLDYNQSIKLMAVSPSPEFQDQVQPGPEYQQITDEIYNVQHNQS